MTQLESLRMSRCFPVVHAWPSSLTFLGLTGATGSRISGCDFTQLIQLEKLVLNSFTVSRMDAFSHLSRMTSLSLRLIDISEYDAVDGDIKRSLSRLTQLRHLEITESVDLVDQGIDLSNLESLYLESTTCLGVALDLPNLTKLRLCSEPELSAASLVHLTSLVELDVTAMDDFNCEDIALLTGLRRLTLDSSENFPINRLFSMPSLECLTLYYDDTGDNIVARIDHQARTLCWSSA